MGESQDEKETLQPEDMLSIVNEVSVVLHIAVHKLRAGADPLVVADVLEDFAIDTVFFRARYKALTELSKEGNL